jgi:beta-glucosidase
MKTKYFTISGLVLLAVLSAIVMSGCCSSCKSGKISLCNTIDLNSTTVIPVSKANEEWWAARQAAIDERVKQGNVDIIFFGDSITHGWDSQPQLWQQYFGKWQTINAGFGGDRTQNVLWRIENGGFANISPKVCMIMIGTNNSNGEDNTAEEIADGIKAIVCKLRTELPQTKILLLAIFSRGEGPSAQREKNAQASKLASEIADNKTVYYMDINDKFLDKDGILSKDIMPDLLHLSEKGYKIWGDAVTPKIEELMAK